MGILKDAFNNPVEDLLEYHPWTESKAPEGINALAAEDDLPFEDQEFNREELIRKITEEIEIMKNEENIADPPSPILEQADNSFDKSEKNEEQDEEQMIQTKQEELINQLNLSLINEETFKDVNGTSLKKEDVRNMVNKAMSGQISVE